MQKITGKLGIKRKNEGKPEKRRESEGKLGTMRVYRREKGEENRGGNKKG